MVRLEVKNIYTNKPVLERNGVFVVQDTHKYEIRYISEQDICSPDVYLEDYLISKTQCSPNKREIIVKDDLIFVDSRGMVDLIIEGNEFVFDVWSHKLSYVEIEQMVLYLYNHNDKFLYSFLSRNKSRTEKTTLSNTDIPLSAKYVKKLSSILDEYDKLLPNFTNLPHTVIRKQELMCDYGEIAKEYDINWLLNNLDTVDIDDRYQQHPNAICFLGDEYGWINKIKTTENVVSFDNYENNIVLSGLYKIQCEVLSAKKTIQIAIEKELVKVNNIQNAEMANDYVSFSEIKCFPLLKTEKVLKLLYDRVVKIISHYTRIFKGLNIREVRNSNLSLNYTSVFRYFSHYKKIFKEITWLYNNRLKFPTPIFIDF